jgi:hypothetical protein
MSVGEMAPDTWGSFDWTGQQARRKTILPTLGNRSWF